MSEKPTSDPTCSFCGCTTEGCSYMVRSPMGPCICDTCALTAIQLMIGKRKDGEE